MRRTRYTKEIWQKAFASMTSGVGVGEVLLGAAILAVLSVLSAAPYFHYLIAEVIPGGEGTAGLQLSALLLSQLFMLFILCLLSALTGLSFYGRYDLPGFGNPTRMIRDIPLLFFLGTAMAVLSYLFFDRFFYKISPVSYPKDVLYMISLVCKGALADEVILRLCFVTICVGILSHKDAGIILASVIATLFIIKYYRFIGMPAGVGALFITQLFLSFIVNLFMGYLFVYRGLLYAMAFKVFFGIRYIVAWVETDNPRDMFESLLTMPVFFS